MKKFALLALFLLLFLSAATRAEEAGVPILIDEYLDKVLHLRLSPNASSPRSGNDPDLLPYSKVRKIDCGAPFEIESFCRKTSRLCKSNICWSPNAVEWQAENQHQSPTWKRAFRTAKVSFDQMISAPDMQAMCCGPDKSCRDYFSKTQLKILQGLGYGNLTSHFAYNDHAVYVSEEVLLSCENRECIERIFLHELGHACQTSRNGALPMMALVSACPFSGTSIADFDNTVGVQTRECVLQALKDHQTAERAKNKPICASYQGTEAFADIIFSAWRKRPAHWAWDCNADPDERHPDPKGYLQCIFARALPKHSVCK
ncbi:hypothetical protein WDW37_00100 [Bdellovibrionota bacterium FG-1]